MGSHKGVSKCGALYAVLPALPPELHSKIKNIFLFILFNTLDRTEYKNPLIFSKIVEEINFLQSQGINVNVDGKIVKVYFALTLITGDNLGLNSILGFVESFKAKHFCRFCKISYENINSTFYQHDLPMRNKKNYEKDVQTNDSSKTGVKEDCVFHKIKLFHATLNRFVDVMHDVLEGILRYDLARIISAFIKKNILL